MKVLDLFSGIGGFSLGLERAGMETVAFCEIDPFCRKVLRKHWPDVPIYEDVRELTKEKLEADGITADLITAGFPCQPFSTSGERRGAEDDRNLWPETIRLIREIQPGWFLGENVVGLVSMELDKVLADLEESAYSAGAFIIPACAVNAGHRRDRVWIIAHAACVRLKGSGRLIQSERSAQGDYCEASGFVDAFQRDALPYVCREHDGVSERLDESQSRLAALGNAVVPQVVEVIGRAIMECES